jgi:hypothetical protein
MEEMAAPSTDLERVERWLGAGAIKHTLDPATPNTVDLARFIACANGVRREELPDAGPPRPEAEAALVRAVGPVGRHFLFVLLDGMGMNLIEATLPPSSFLRRHLVQPIHSVFPATTTAALNSLASAVHPSAHGLPGWTVRTATSTGEEITATPLPFIEDGTGAPLGSVGVDPSELFSAPPVYSLYRRPAHQVSAYAGTEFSDYSTAWCPSTIPESPIEAVATVAERWRASSASASSAGSGDDDSNDGETFTYFYNAEPDSSSHKFGWKSDVVAAELVALDAALEQLWATTTACSGRTIVVTADHGHLECHGDQTMLLGAEPEDDEILSLLRCSPTVEPRTPGFHVHPDGDGAAPGANCSRFAAAFRASRFGQKFALLSAAEAEALELFGPAPMGERCRAHIGDFVAISPENVVIMSKDVGMVGQHGGATAAEMEIPLIVASDLRDPPPPPPPHSNGSKL